MRTNVKNITIIASIAFVLLVGTACVNTNTSNAQAQKGNSDITKEALGIANSIKASLAYYGLATGAYTEGNEVGPFLNVSSLKKTGNASNTIVNTADYEIAQGLAASAQDRLAKLIARANNTAATPEITSALAASVSFKNQIDNKLPYNIVEDQATQVTTHIDNAFKLNA
jgi:hypothetical protein